MGTHFVHLKKKPSIFATQEERNIKTPLEYSWWGILCSPHVLLLQSLVGCYLLFLSRKKQLLIAAASFLIFISINQIITFLPYISSFYLLLNKKLFWQIAKDYVMVCLLFHNLMLPCVYHTLCFKIYTN